MTSQLSFFSSGRKAVQKVSQKAWELNKSAWDTLERSGAKKDCFHHLSILLNRRYNRVHEMYPKRKRISDELHPPLLRHLNQS